MNGVHDMGGMDGLGALEHERDEPVFHAPWEGRALAITLAAGAWRRWNIDASRHERELIPGAEYLRLSYYEKWIEALRCLLVKSGLVSPEEMASGRAAAGAAKATPPLTADKVWTTLSKGGPSARDVQAAPRFAVGDPVRARNIHPAGHTRLPRYARGKLGVIRALYGVHVFPDSNAHFRGESPQHLYSVRFTARELWGPDAAPKDHIHLDLWEDHLEPG